MRGNLINWFGNTESSSLTANALDMGPLDLPALDESPTELGDFSPDEFGKACWQIVTMSFYGVMDLQHFLRLRRFKHRESEAEGKRLADLAEQINDKHVDCNSEIASLRCQRLVCSSGVDEAVLLLKKRIEGGTEVFREVSRYREILAQDPTLHADYHDEYKEFLHSVKDETIFLFSGKTVGAVEEREEVKKVDAVFDGYVVEESLADLYETGELEAVHVSGDENNNPKDVSDEHQ